MLDGGHHRHLGDMVEPGMGIGHAEWLEVVQRKM